MTVKEFAKILSEEFDRDCWGTIDPWLFKEIVDGNGSTDSESLKFVLLRVLNRLKENARK